MYSAKEIERRQKEEKIMKKFKKVMIGAVATTLAVTSLAGCGKKESEKETETRKRQRQKQLR